MRGAHPGDRCAAFEDPLEEAALGSARPPHATPPGPGYPRPVRWAGVSGWVCTAGGGTAWDVAMRGSA